MGGVCRAQFFPLKCVRGEDQKATLTAIPGVDNIQPLPGVEKNLGLPCERTLKCVEDSNEGGLDLKNSKYILKSQ